MVNLKNKKGAVELSLNLIIMLIIGMVVLGLVIGFVNSLVSQGTDSFETQLGDNEKLKLEEVARCSDNLCMLPDPSINAKKGGQQNVFIKVRAFGDEVSCNAGPLDAAGGCGVGYEVLDQEGADATDYVRIGGAGFNVPQGEEDSQMYVLIIDKEAPVGVYYLVMKLYPDSDEEVTKTITVNVS